MERPRSTNNMRNQVELASLQPMAGSGTLFGEGFSSPWSQLPNGSVSYTTVQQLLSMAEAALSAKQQAAEVLMAEVKQLKRSAEGDPLLQRAQRAEVDSSLLLEQLQGLMQTKAVVAQQRADLDRANALLMAERALLCEQLDVSPDNMNLCQAVQRVLAAAKRTRALEMQLRLLARCQRDALLQLEATKEQEARAARQWQACEQVYLDTLAAHGIPRPGLPATPSQHVSSAGNSSGPGLSGSVSSGGAPDSSGTGIAVYQQLLQRLSSGPNTVVAALAGSGSSSEKRTSAGTDVTSGSPASHTHLLPPTPPASDLNVANGTYQIRRSLSLDSGLHSLTGLLDQLALGQLGSDDLGEYEYDDSYDHESRDGDNWMLVDAMSDEQQGSAQLREQAGMGSSAGTAGAAADGNEAAAAAVLLMLGGSSSSCGHGHAQQQVQQKLMQQHQQQLQTVEEAQEEQLQAVDEAAAISSAPVVR